jgi:hypothetical protein
MIKTPDDCPARGAADAKWGRETKGTRETREIVRILWQVGGLGHIEIHTKAAQGSREPGN